MDSQVAPAQAEPTPEDLAWVARWRPQFLSAGALILLDFHGAAAGEMARLRCECAIRDARIVVARNQRLRELVRDTPLALLAPYFKGQTAIVLARSHPYALRRLFEGGWSLKAQYQNIRTCRVTVRCVWWQDHVVELETIEAPEAPPEEIPGEIAHGAWIVSAAELDAIVSRLRPWLQSSVQVWESPALILGEVGPNRLAVMSCLRRILGYSLQEAKRLVDSPPPRLELPSVDVVNELTASLRKLGAEVTGLGTSDGRRGSEVDIQQEELFAVLPTLWMREGYRLRARVFSSPGGSHSHVWAHGPMRVSCDVSLALCGDGSLASYLLASLLLRELGDFAADWHGIVWRAHTIIDHPSDHLWKWSATGRSMQQFEPRVVRRDDGFVEVMFCTEVGLGTMRIIAHIDRYPPHTFSPITRQIELATGGPGWVP